MSELTNTSSDIILNDYLKDKKILHLNEKMNFNNASRIFIENPEYDMITYLHEESFMLYNYGALKIDYNGKPYIDFQVDSCCDMIDNFEVVADDDLIDDICYIIGGLKYTQDKLKKWVHISSIYHTFTIRITFNRTLLQMFDNKLRKFNINMRYYLMKNDIRRPLVQHKVITDEIIYSKGISSKGYNDRFF
jgi:hypothetical protein